MSRSYKKTPHCNWAKPDKWYKKHFNRKIRRNKRFDDLPGGNAYRKANESWDIVDSRSMFVSYQEFKESQIELGYYEDEKQCRSDYEKEYLRK